MPGAPLTVVVPAYEEQRRLPATIARLQTVLGRRGGWFEIVVVDDGSRDGTAEMARAALEGVGDRGVVLQIEHAGKGAAVRRGMLAARGDAVLFTDADLSTPIEDLDLLMAALDAGADVAIGSRAVDRRLVEVPQAIARDWLGRTFNLVARSLATPGIWDTQCGFKLFRAAAARAVFARQRLAGFGFDVETIAVARRLGFRVVEVPVRWRNDPDSRMTLRGGAAAFLDPFRVAVNLRRGRYDQPADQGAPARSRPARSSC